MNDTDRLSTDMIALDCDTAIIEADGERMFAVKLNHRIIAGYEDTAVFDCGDLVAIDRLGNVMEMPDAFTVLEIPALHKQ